MFTDPSGAVTACDGGFTATFAAGAGEGVTVGVTAGVVAAVAVGVTVGVAVAVPVAADVSVAVGVRVEVAVLVTVGVSVLVNVGVAVAVSVAVDIGVLVKVDVDVSVLVAVAVGATNVTVPPVAVARIGELAMSVSDALTASDELPSATVAKRTVARTPSPLGPPKPPELEQPKLTLPEPTRGGKHATERPVEPRNEPLVTLTKDRTVESQVSVKA